MTADEIKKIIKDRKIDRRKLALAIGVSPPYLGNILNGWANLKRDRQEVIEKFIKK